MTTEAANGPVEMGRSVRQIVDNSLEEGQFESAIAMLEQLRSPDHKPSTIHILHLIFIALHSSSHINRLDDSGADPVYDRESLLKSPRKIIKQSKSALILSPEAILSAQRLIHSFITTNPPQVIGAALPHYPENEAKRSSNLDGEGGVQFVSEFVDSPIYNQSISIKNARSVWEVLKEGFVQRAAHAFATPKGKTRARQSLKTRSLAKEASLGAINITVEGENIQAVGEESWIFLEWLVALFEKDAETFRSEVRYSPLLLRQLPPPPYGTNTRWDASEPVKVAFYALQQDDFRRQRSGVRLLSLLIDLTYAQFLNLPSFATTVLAQLTHSSASSRRPSPSGSPSMPSTPLPTHTGFDPLTNLFTLLPSTATTLPFRVALCQQILQDLSDTPSSSARSAPKPTPRTTGSFRNKDVDLADAPKLGINPATGQPIVSAMKKVQPRPRTGTITSAPSSKSAGGSSDAMLSPPQVASVPSDDSAVSGAPTHSSDPAAPVRLPRITLPPFAEVLELTKVPSAKRAQAKPERQTRGRPHLAVDSETIHQLLQKPWSASDVLLRVRFEFLLACVTTLVLPAREANATQAPVISASDAEKVADWKQALVDGRLKTLIAEVFTPSSNAEDQKEKEDKVFYADVIRAVVGYDVES